MPFRSRPVRCLQVVAVAFALLLTACSSPASRSSSGNSGESFKGKTLKIGFGSEPDLQDVPTLLAFEDLKAKGINVEPVAYNQTDLLLQALVTGETQIAAGSLGSLLVANESGANLLAIEEQSGNDWQLITKANITDPKQLQGSRLAYHSELAFDRAMEQELVDNLQVKPNWVLMPGSEVRAAALLAGKIDATAASAQDAILIHDKAPNGFHTLVSFQDSLPNLITAVYFSKKEFLDANGPLVREVLTAITNRYKQAQQDKGATIKAEAGRFLKNVDQSLIDKSVDEYMKLNYWMPDGGMTRDRAEFSAGFYTKANQLKAKPAIDSFYTEAYIR